jgi:alpha/beta superfamily hydrolase
MTASTLTTGDGLRLEMRSEAPERVEAAIVLCHPHPDMGGTMNAPLLLALRDGFLAEGWAVLRFNFRGVGTSSGERSEGIQEVADAEAAVAWARREWPDVPVAIVGWSFGAGVAIRAAERDDSLEACVAIAPPVEGRPRVTAGLPPATELDLGVPLLFVCAGHDEVTPPEPCRRWIRNVEYADLLEIPAANHFFWGRYEQLASRVNEWLAQRFRAQR